MGSSPPASPTGLPRRRRRAAHPERAAFAVRQESLLEALTTPFGWYDDDVAFAQPWGFEPAHVHVPVDLRYGRDDVFVPPTHGEWLAALLPRAQVTCWENHGHMGDGLVLDDYRALVIACRS